MASIRKRGKSYQIRVSCGYDLKGIQIIRTKTWKPDPDMTEKQVEKELNRQAVLFEQQCLRGCASPSIKFADFTAQWYREYAEKKLKRTHLDHTRYTLRRINAEIGHLRLDRIGPPDIQFLINSLCEGNKSKGYKPLAPKSIKNYISCASSVFSYAIRLGMLQHNPCRNANLPNVQRTEREMYTLEEAQIFLDRLTEKAPIKYQCYFILMIYSGFRRGEMCGLTWQDIDFENHIITINKALYHITNTGNVLDTPKTKSSNRCLKLPDIVFEYLERLKKFYDGEEKKFGTKWIENDFVFKRETGEVLSPYTPAKWLLDFCKRENIKHVTPHSFRHLNASLLIDSGANVKTVQACLGHSDASTTLDIYAHAFSKAQAMASSAIATNFDLH